jgi:3-oxoacyl-[acyl-carrier-protein] synthase II
MGLMRQCLLKRVNETCNDSPATAVRPFDENAAGTAVGEGGGLLVLEEYEHATKRGARIYAEIVGFGASQDSYSVTTPSPTGDSYGKAITKALSDAKLAAGEVDLLVPHGLGIPSHDRAELAGLKQAFGPALEKVGFAPIKGQIGSLAAGSGADAAAAVLCLHGGRVPGAINTKKVIDGVKLNVAAEAREAKLGVAVSSVYSLGGQNAALVLKGI